MMAQVAGFEEISLNMFWCTAFMYLVAVVPSWDVFDPEQQFPVAVPVTPASQLSSTELNEKLLGWQWSSG